jgi:hypothetical protein
VTSATAMISKSIIERLDIGQDYTFFPLCNIIPHCKIISPRNELPRT